MVKGICKEIIVVKGDGKIIEEAIFILRKPSGRVGKNEIAEEANRIIREKTSLYEKESARRRRAFMKIIGEDI